MPCWFVNYSDKPVFSDHYWRLGSRNGLTVAHWT